MAAAEKKELTREDAEFLPVQYDMQRAQINKLKKLYDPKLIPDAKEKGDEGYLVVHEKAMAIVKVRSAIEVKRKDLKADALAWGKEVDTEAKRLTAIIVGLEEPWKKLKSDLDEKEAKEAEEARQKEALRIEAIEKKVAALQNATAGLMGASVEKLEEELKLVSDVVVDELYGDYVEVAELHKANAIKAINTTIDERKVFEEQQAKLKADQETAAKAQKEIDDKTAAAQKAIDEKTAELEKIQQANEAEAARLKAEADKIEDEKAAVVLAEKEKKEKEDRDKLEKSQQEEKAKELQARLPEDEKMRAYANSLRAVETPDVKNSDMKSLLDSSTVTLNGLSDFIYKQTQGK